MRSFATVLFSVLIVWIQFGFSQPHEATLKALDQLPVPESISEFNTVFTSRR